MHMVKDHIEITQRFMLLCKFIGYLINYFRKKEGLEKEIKIIEKDLEKLNSYNVIVDLTR